MPPINHLILIPMTLLIGFYVGWSLGSRHVRNEWQRAEKRRKAAE